MKDRPEVPKFANEEEEANWWFENRRRVEEAFVDAVRTGRSRGESTVLRRVREAANALTTHLSAAQRGQDETGYGADRH